MWTCPGCSKPYPEQTNCDCGYIEAFHEMPAVQTIFSSAPGFDEDRDGRRRNIGLCIALINILGLVAFFHWYNVDIERATQVVAYLLVAAGSAFWAVRKWDKGFGLAVLAGTAAFFALCILAGAIILIRFWMAG